MIDKLTPREIYTAFLENRDARKKAGFPNAGDYAVEDTAILLDIAIADVCQAVSFIEREDSRGFVIEEE